MDGGQHIIFKEKDKVRDNYLRKQGYKVLRFWDNEVLNNRKGVLEVIREELLPLHPNPLPPHPNPLPQGEREKRKEKESPPFLVCLPNPTTTSKGEASQFHQNT